MCCQITGKTRSFRILVESVGPFILQRFLADARDLFSRTRKLLHSDSDRRRRNCRGQAATCGSVCLCLLLLNMSPASCMTAPLPVSLILQFHFACTRPATFSRCKVPISCPWCRTLEGGLSFYLQRSNWLVTCLVMSRTCMTG